MCRSLFRINNNDLPGHNFIVNFHNTVWIAGPCSKDDKHTKNDSRVKQMTEYIFNYCTCLFCMQMLYKSVANWVTNGTDVNFLIYITIYYLLINYRLEDMLFSKKNK